MSSVSPYEQGDSPNNSYSFDPYVAAPNSFETAQNGGYAATAASDGANANGNKKPSIISNFNFVKHITERSGVTRAGQPKKRRGPKPDAKPAISRRQELNRHAQRTHRQRKELYVKSLEVEMVNAKDTENNLIAAKELLEVENWRLKELLESHGIAYAHLCAPLAETDNTNYDDNFGSNFGSFSIGSDSMDQVNTLSPAATTPSTQPSPENIDPALLENTDTVMANIDPALMATSSSAQQSPENNDSGFMELKTGGSSATLMPQNGVDHDRLGVQLILALEEGCHDHQQMMVERAETKGPGGEPRVSGHALMLSCPPRDHVINNPGVLFPHKKAYDISPNVIMNNLLNLSGRIPYLRGEITPVQALVLLRTHERYAEVTENDYEFMMRDLKKKSKCYGFGAVLADLEMQDTLIALFASKDKQAREDAGIVYVNKLLSRDHWDDRDLKM